MYAQNDFATQYTDFRTDLKHIFDLSYLKPMVQNPITFGEYSKESWHRIRNKLAGLPIEIGTLKHSKTKNVKARSHFCERALSLLMLNH